MQLLAIILGLAASASAVDIALRIRSGCDSRGGGWVCTNINPNVNMLSVHKPDTPLDHTISNVSP